MTFPFRDGPAKIEVGQSIFVVSGQGRQGYNYEATVLKIGRKYVAVGFKDGCVRSEFVIATGYQNTTLGAKDVVYTSAAAYDRICSEQAVIDSVKVYFRNYSTTITYEQALKIKEILDIK